MKRLRAVELKRINAVIKDLWRLANRLSVTCPVCKEVKSKQTFICASPVAGINAHLCPVRARCESFVEITSGVSNAIASAIYSLREMRLKLEKMQNCKHHWTADSDSGRNICIDCEAFETA